MSTTDILILLGVIGVIEVAILVGYLLCARGILARPDPNDFEETQR